MTLNLESDISSFVNTIYEGALLVTRENNLMAALVTQFGDRTGLATRSNQQYSGGTMNAIGEDDDLVGQAFTPSAIATLTPTEKGGQYFLTDSRIETDPFPVRADAAQDLGMAMATKIETDLIGLFTSLTAGTIGGGAGSAVTWSYFYNMVSVLRNAKAPLPYVCVMHPYHWGILGKAVAPGATVTNSPRFQDAISQNFYVGSVSGVEIYTSANIPISGTAAYDAMFARQAMALDMRRAPRLEVERDASRRGYELNFTSVYAVGAWRPAFGVCGYFDAATPTT